MAPSPAAIQRTLTIKPIPPTVKNGFWPSRGDLSHQAQMKTLKGNVPLPRNDNVPVALPDRH